LRSEVVTYVAGTFCYPCLRAGPRENGGADGIRTHDLLDAIEARSQLRHGPTVNRFFSLPHTPGRFPSRSIDSNRGANQIVILAGLSSQTGLGQIPKNVRHSRRSSGLTTSIHNKMNALAAHPS